MPPEQVSLFIFRHIITQEALYYYSFILLRDLVNKTFRLPLKLVQELQAIAQNKGVSLNNLVLQCCEYAIKHLDK